MKNFVLGFLVTILAAAVFAIARFLIRRHHLKSSGTQEDLIIGAPMRGREAGGNAAAGVRHLEEEGGGFIGILKEGKAGRPNICSRDDIAAYFDDKEND